MKPHEIAELILEENPKAELIEDFHGALIGTAISASSQGKRVAAYDSDICINILMHIYGMSDLEALKHFQLLCNPNKNGNSPVFISDFRQSPEKELMIRLKNFSVDDMLDNILDKL